MLDEIEDRSLKIIANILGSNYSDLKFIRFAFCCTGETQLCVYLYVCCVNVCTCNCVCALLGAKGVITGVGAAGKRKEGALTSDLSTVHYS